ncbi:MAG: ABC transporter ATP-binding protein [Clostridia bacterium]|nr:ABC transporter ATP-binding protein [Clostridia bacterium]
MVRNLEELKKRYNFGSTGGGKGPGGPGKGPGRGARPTGKPKSSKGTVKRLLSYLAPYKLRFVFIFLCLIVTTLTSLVGSYMMAPIIDEIIPASEGAATEELSGAEDFAHKIINRVTDSMEPFVRGIVGEDAAHSVCYLFTGLFILACIYVVAIVCTYIQQKLLVGVSQSAIQRIRNQLFDKVQSLPLKFHDSTTTGETMSRFTNDVDNIGVMFDSTAVSLVSGVVTLVGTLCIMLYVNPLLAAITVVFTPIFALGGGKIAKHSSKYYSAQQAALGSVNGYIEESVAGQKVVKVFNHEDECVEEFALLNDDLREKQTKAMFYGGIMGPIMGNISKLSYAVTAGVGGILCYLTLNGDIARTSAMALTIGGLTVFVQYANQFARPINEISMQMANIFSALAGAERVFRIMDQPSEPADAVNAEDFAEKGIKGHVILDNVSFGYTDEKTVLKNISLYAKPGQKIAFVGSTGAGKTTITNLLNRFYDIKEGTITIDGVDIKQIERDVLRKNIAMVLQDTHLFTGTVRENIRYGRLDATDAEVVEAAKTAYAHSFIKKLEGGYDTMIEGDGANLSQGQRQLLNIARAALSKAPILVLDEATSSVDTRTERHIERGMDALMEDRTTFVIAHRLSTVRNSNAIMVLEKGEIIERGDHDDLLAQKGRYYELYTGLKELD